MCANYTAVTDPDRIFEFFGVRPASVPEQALVSGGKETWPDQLAPMIRLAPDDGSGERRLELIDRAVFRFVPGFIQKVEWARRTYNARSETVARLPTYRDAWRRGQRCIILAEDIFEPNYEEDGAPVRWRIRRADGQPMGIAGIYETWTHPETGEEAFSMSMLTVNADNHPFMKRFHAPHDEKRMVVILDREEFHDWLACPVADSWKHVDEWHGELVGGPAAPPPRAKKPPKPQPVKPPAPLSKPPPPPPDEQPGLF